MVIVVMRITCLILALQHNDITVTTLTFWNSGDFSYGGDSSDRILRVILVLVLGVIMLILMMMVMVVLVMMLVMVMLGMVFIVMVLIMMVLIVMLLIVMMRLLPV